jgi:pyridoxine 4-dehydrogenase
MVTDTSSLAGHPVRRMGFGAMQLPGPGVFGPPRDRSQALAVLRKAVDSGVNHIDTAQFYGPNVANELIHEALHPYPEDLILVSKVGARRDDRGAWHGAQAPDELRAGVEANLQSLGLEQIPVVNLRRHPDSDVPLDEQVDAMVELRREGRIGALGLSNVTPDEYSKRGPNPTSLASRTPTTSLTAATRSCSISVPAMALRTFRSFLWVRPSTR